MVLAGQGEGQGQEQGRQGRQGPVRRARVRGRGPDPHAARRVRRSEPAHNHRTSASSTTAARPARCTTRSREPDRSVDNTTIWTADFNQAHYDNLLYNKAANPSMANWYLEQSSGKYSVDGYVSDWVQVPEQRGRVWQQLLRQHRLHARHRAVHRGPGRRVVERPRCRAGQRLPPPTTFLATFDVWDRYDWNGDGNFDEPDGYIDHFQSVHAGEGEETGGGAQGADAIWSHRSYVNSVPVGGDGPMVGGGRTCRRRPHRRQQLLDRRLHRRARERRRRRVRARVRPRPRPAGPVRHRRQHGRREQHRLVDPVMSQGSYGTVNGEDLGSAPDALDRVGEVPARLARTTKSPSRARRHVQPRPGRDQHQEAAGDVHRPAGQGSDGRGRRAVGRRCLLLLGLGQRPQQHDDQVRHPRWRADQPLVRDPLPHRAVLGLRVLEVSTNGTDWTPFTPRMSTTRT